MYSSVWAGEFDARMVWRCSSYRRCATGLMFFPGTLVQTASGKTHTIEGCLTPPQVKALASGAFPNLFRAATAQSAPDGAALADASASDTPDVFGLLDAPSAPLISGAGGAEVAAADVAARAGLIHRLIHGLFHAIDAAGADTSFKLSCQLIEIYNEGLRDLLQRGISAETRRATRAGGGSTLRAQEVSPMPVDPLRDGEAAESGGRDDGEGDDPDDSMATAGDRGSSTARSASSTGGGGDEEDERLRLLRSAVSSGKTTGSDTPLGAESDVLQIREDPERGVFVAGAAQLPVTCARHVFEALALGAAHRSTASTGMNERSSRSHSVLQLYVTQRRLDSMTTVRSTLTIVDLAGSERVRELCGGCRVRALRQLSPLVLQVAKTGTVGARLDEAKKILFSLHALSNVINALTDGRASHVPYRDSKWGRSGQAGGGTQRRSDFFLCSSCLPQAHASSSGVPWGQLTHGPYP